MSQYQPPMPPPQPPAMPCLSIIPPERYLQYQSATADDSWPRLLGFVGMMAAILGGVATLCSLVEIVGLVTGGFRMRGTFGSPDLYTAMGVVRCVAAPLLLIGGILLAARKYAGAVVLCIYAATDILLLFLGMIWPFLMGLRGRSMVNWGATTVWYVAVGTLVPAILLHLMTRPATRRALQT